MKPCKNVRMPHPSYTSISVLLLVALSLTNISLAATDTVIPEGTQIRLQLNTPISTGKNSEGDPFQAIVTEPVYIGERMAIPKGSVVAGSISRIMKPGRMFKGKAALTLLFQSINIPGRGELPIVASLTGVDRQGNRGVSSEGTIEGSGSEGRDVARVLTPGLVGTGIGTLIGGGKGAGIGAGIGAVVGLATVFSSRGKDIEMQRGASLDIALDKALSLPEGEATAAKNR
jgi:hypothetical protein